MVSDAQKQGQAQPQEGKPDPTILTTEQSLRGLASLREFLEERIKGAVETIGARLAGGDKAIELLQRSTDKTPEYIAAAVTQLKALHDERFTSVQTQFRERDTRTTQKEQDNKVSIDAALAASQKSVDKTELNFTKQIDETGKRIDTVSKSADEKVADLKERFAALENRMVAMESRRVSEVDTKKDTGTTLTIVLAGAGVLIALVSLLVVMLKHG